MPPCEMCRFDPNAPVSEFWSRKIKSYVPTVNTISTNTKNNHKYRGWKKTWETELGPWLQSLPPAQQYRRVTITRWYGKGKRAFDRKNFEGGCKPLLDTLKNYGAVYDDSAMWCEDHYSQQSSPDGIDYVEVKIEELCACHAKCPHAQKDQP